VAVHELDLLIQRQAFEQIGDARVVAQFGVAKRIIHLRSCFERYRSKEEKEKEERFFTSALPHVYDPCCCR
jgi:hypothetical protein